MVTLELNSTHIDESINDTYADGVLVGVADLSAIFVPCDLGYRLTAGITSQMYIISVHR